MPSDQIDFYLEISQPKSAGKSSDGLSSIGIPFSTRNASILQSGSMEISSSRLPKDHSK